MRDLVGVSPPNHRPDCLYNLVHALVERPGGRVESQEWIDRGLVRRGDPRELHDFPGPSSPVEALRMPRLADIERRADVDFEEAVRTDDPARLLPVVPEWRDDWHEHDGSGVVE